MKKFRGAVLFVDLLGFGFLTRGRLKLEPLHYAPWKISPLEKEPHQRLAARILLEFRRALRGTKRAEAAVEIAQLSDCAFVWSTDVNAVARAGRHLMHNAMAAGLLCRGGLAFGQIVAPDTVDRSLGKFIVGDAVTRAVDNEKLGKGARVFTDSVTVDRFNREPSFERFATLTNPMTADSVREWKWYTPKEVSTQQPLRAEVRRELEHQVVRYAMLRHSTKFAWNAASEEGCRQLACSVEPLAKTLEEISGGLRKYRVPLATLLKFGIDMSKIADATFQQGMVNQLLSDIERRGVLR